MNIKLSDDQVEILRQARRFCENEMPMTYVRAMFEDERGYTEEVWNKMVEIGWTAMLLPEAYGGLSMELLDMNLVLQEMGRAVSPGPLFSTILLGASAIVEAGNETQKQKYLPLIAEGKLMGTLALHEIGSGADPSYIMLEGKKKGDGFTLSGTKMFVPDAHISDFMVCPVRTAKDSDLYQAITLLLVDTKSAGVMITPLPTMDGTRKLCVVEFKDVSAGKDAILGEANHGWGPLKKIMQKAQVALCAECVGGAERAMEIASEYAKVRVQFDQPIGSFQAIKHRCAQMYVDVESARSLLYYASWAQDHCDEVEAAIAASAAKVYCTEAYRNVSASAIQVLGGTGFSWEHDIQFYLKRAKANEVALGDPAYHRENVIGLVAI